MPRILLLVLLTACGLSYGPTVEILFRPSATAEKEWLLKQGRPIPQLNPLFSDFEQQVEGAGHAAIVLPGDAHNEPRVLGWSPDQEALPHDHPIKDITYSWKWLLNTDSNGNMNTAPGSFSDDTEWAIRHSQSPHAKVRAIKVDVSDQELATIRANIQRVDREGRYQMAVNRSAGEETFPQNHFNCITAVGEAFRGTHVEGMGLFPKDGRMRHFAEGAFPHAEPWRPCNYLFSELAEAG